MRYTVNLSGEIKMRNFANPFLKADKNQLTSTLIIATGKVFWCEYYVSIFSCFAPVSTNLLKTLKRFYPLRARASARLLLERNM